MRFWFKARVLMLYVDAVNLKTSVKGRQFVMFDNSVANVYEYKFLRFGANPQKYLPAKNSHLKVA